MKKLLMMLAISLVMVACKKDETEIDPKKLSVEDSYYEIDPAELIGTYWKNSTEARTEYFDNNGKLVAVTSGEWIGGIWPTIMKFEENTIWSLEYNLSERYAGELTVNYDINGNTIMFFTDKFEIHYTMFTKDIMLRCVTSRTIDAPYTTKDGIEIKKGYCKKQYRMLKRKSEESLQSILDVLYRNNIDFSGNDDGYIDL